MNSPWQAAQVMTNHEKRVTEQLTARSVEHYLPLYTEKSRWTDRTVTLERPLFPGYVFIRFVPGNRITVLSTPGVLHLLGKQTAGMVPPEEIERIRTALAKGYLLRPHPQIARGMRVRMKHGVFAGMEGKVLEVRGNCKVVMALTGVDQYFSLSTKIDDLEIMNDE